MRANRTLVEEILRRVSECQNCPSANRVFFLHGPPLSGKTAVVQEVASRASGVYIDLLANKLSALVPTIGTYKPKDFQRDVVDWSHVAGSLLVIDEVESLFDTWKPDQQADAIRLLSGTTARTRCPVLISTRVQLDYACLMGNQEKVFEVPTK